MRFARYLVVLAALALPVRAEAPRVALLMVGFNVPEQEVYLRRLAAQGIDSDRCELKDLTAERLKGIQVVVLADPGWTRNDYTPSPELTAAHELLQHFVEGGGGLFVNLYYGQHWQPPLAACLLANRFGADYSLCELRDPATEATATAWSVRFAYTDQVPASPISEGVKGVWYPVTAGGFGMTSPVGGIKLGDGWTSFLNAGRAARAVPSPTGIPAVDQRSLKPLDPPYSLLAGRAFGQGRVALTNVPHGFTVSSGTAPALEGVVLDQGLYGKPSDLGRLYVNLYRWLAEPAAAAGLGGAAGKFPAVDPAARTAPPPAPGLVVWDKFVFPTPKRWTGVVGARSALSGGRGTVHEWCQRARAAGLDFLGFAEDYAALPPDKLKQVTAECKTESSDTFLAVPGFILADELDDHFFLLGTDLKAPDPDLLSADGKRLALNLEQHPTWQFADVWLDYFYNRLSFRCTVGSCLHRTGIPYYDYRDYQAVAVVTRQNGQTLDDLTDGYLDLQASGQNLQPYALELMTEPAELDRVAKGGYRVVILDNDWIQKCTLAKHFDLWHSTYESFHQCVTSGPEILQWERMASHDYWAEGDRWHPGYYESRLRGALRSDVGLKEVRIYDNARLVRRYDTGGAKEYAVEFKFTREQQHGFVLIAEDVRGGRAITGTYNTQSNQFEEFMCGDRNNQLAYGSGWWPDGTFFKLGNGLSPATPNKGPWNAMIMGCGPYKWDPKVGVGVSTFDGSPETDPLFNVYPVLYTEPANDEPAPALHAKADRLLVTNDVMIGQGTVDGVFPKGFRALNVWHTAERIQPTQVVAARRRFTLWNTRPGGPVCTVVEGEVGAKQAVKQLRPAEVAVMDSRGAQGWSLRDGRGGYAAGRKAPGKSLAWQAGPFVAGACVTFFDSSLGATALVSLADGLSYYLDTPTASRFGLRGPQTATLTPDQPIRYRLLLASWPRTTPPSDELTDRFLAAYGLGRAPGYTLTVEQGRVLGQAFTLDAEAADGGFAGTVAKADLPTGLCVMVHGLNDRWSAGYLDRTGQRYRGIGVLEGVGYAQIDPSARDQSFYLGHPVTCDRPELRINAMQTGNGSFHVEVHNPGTQPLTAHLQVAPALAERIVLLKPEVTVPAGASVVVLEATKG